MSRFGRVSYYTCCHGNALNTFGLKILNLERGAKQNGNKMASL